ncbi:MAG TPA: DinB family protein [Ktedonobacterales bacterium]|nr:DinB family protein [Ktedonobacterales bacterium]
MAEYATGVMAFYQGWDVYQELLIKTIAPLTSEQLTLRSTSLLRSVGENCTHIIGARGRWCSQVLGIGGQTSADYGRWDRPDAPTRNAAELAGGLRDSWSVLQEALQNMTVAQLSQTIPNTDREPGEPEVFTRQWVIWHLIEHDVHHGGEISQILGAHGLSGLDL